MLLFFGDGLGVGAQGFGGGFVGHGGAIADPAPVQAGRELVGDADGGFFGGPGRLLHGGYLVAGCGTLSGHPSGKLISIMNRRSRFVRGIASIESVQKMKFGVFTKTGS